jgi:hypothetical protein
MFRSIAFRGLALTALLGIGFPSMADDSLPFHGSGYEMITGGNETGTVLMTDGEGVATHLGHFTRHLVVTVNEDYSLDGDLVITAADGDELFIHLTGSFITLSGVYTITGGTGRFTDASGSADFSATPGDGGVLYFSFAGTIQY